MALITRSEEMSIRVSTGTFAQRKSHRRDQPGCNRLDPTRPTAAAGRRRGTGDARHPADLDRLFLHFSDQSLIGPAVALGFLLLLDTVVLLQRF